MVGGRPRWGIGSSRPGRGPGGRSPRRTGASRTWARPPAAVGVEPRLSYPSRSVSVSLRLSKASGAPRPSPPTLVMSPTSGGWARGLSGSMDHRPEQVRPRRARPRPAHRTPHTTPRWGFRSSAPRPLGELLLTLYRPLRRHLLGKLGALHSLPSLGDSRLWLQRPLVFRAAQHLWPCAKLPQGPIAALRVWPQQCSPPRP